MINPNDFNTIPDTVELDVRLGIFKKRLVIDKLGLAFGKKNLLFSDVESLRYGSKKSSVNGIPSTVYHTFDFLLNSKQKITIDFGVHAFSKKGTFENEEHNIVIIEVLWKHLTLRMVNNMIRTLNEKGTVKVGNFEVQQSGIKITYLKFIFFKDEALVSWNNCLIELGQGSLTVKSKENPKIKAWNYFLYTWDLNAFHALINYLLQDGNCYKLERGEKI